MQTGTDWWGKEDRHVVIDVANPAQVSVGVEVLARAFWIDDQEGRS